MSQTKEEAIEMYRDESPEAGDELRDARLIYSVYETGCYEGGWFTAYVKPDGKIMMDEGGHCSCNGPSFSPREVTREELLAANPYLCGASIDREAFVAAVNATVPVQR